MTKPNTLFELSVSDMEMIETALRRRKITLSKSLDSIKSVDGDVKDALHDIQDLLGRLHNQKEFYRPKSGPYVSG